MTTKPHLVIFSPYPPDKAADNAGAYYFGHYCEQMARQFDVAVITFETEVKQATGHVRLELVAHPHQRRDVPLTQFPRDLVRGLRMRGSLRDALLSHADRTGLLQSADIIEIQWGQFLPLARDLQRRKVTVPLVAFMHDVMAQAQQRIVQRHWKNRHYKQMVRAWLTLPSTARSERRLLDGMDVVSVFSRKDEQLLRERGVRVEILVAQLYCNELPRRAPRPVNGRILITGAMWRPENYEGAERFLREAWPTVQAANPGATLRIVGSRPVPALLKLAGPTVEVIGWVDDLDLEYANAQLFVAPLWSGAGVKHKVLSAMAHALPIVATPVAAEGIDGDNLFVAVVDSPTALAQGVIDALEKREHAERVGQRARDWLESQPTFGEFTHDVARAYQRSIARRKG